MANPFKRYNSGAQTMERNEPTMKSQASRTLENLAAKLEGDIADVVEMSDFTPKASPLPIPEYVQHHPDANQVSRLTAPVVAAEYEQAAKAIERMAAELRASLVECDNTLVLLAQQRAALNEHIEMAIRDCEQAAAAYRERGAVAFNSIQNASILTEEVRRTCSALQDRIRLNEPSPQQQETETNAEDTGPEGEETYG